MRKRNKKESDRSPISISLPKALRAAGKKKAREQRRNFSNYIEFLIDRDVRSQAPLHEARA